MTGSKKCLIAGWVLSGLIGVLLIGLSATFKLISSEADQEQFAKLGLTLDQIKIIGIVEAVITLLFLIPRTAFIGAILLTGYMGGAILTHVRIGEPFIIQAAIGILIWVALGLRKPEVFALAFGSCAKQCGDGS